MMSYKIIVRVLTSSTMYCYDQIKPSNLQCSLLQEPYSVGQISSKISSDVKTKPFYIILQSSIFQKPIQVLIKVKHFCRNFFVTRVQKGIFFAYILLISYVHSVLLGVGFNSTSFERKVSKAEFAWYEVSRPL